MRQEACGRHGPGRAAAADGVSLPRRLASLPILAYRYGLSPLIGPRCRFAPSCSAYAIEAIERHGVVKGAALAVRRLSRCHPVRWLGGSAGFDPVPEKSLGWRDLLRQGETPPSDPPPA